MSNWPHEENAWDAGSRRDQRWHDDDEPEDGPDDDPDGTFADDSEAHDTEPCRQCGAPVYYDAEQCSRCGTYVTDEEPQPRRKSWLIGIGTLICFYIIYHWIFP